jgi:hypothetical protein
MYRKKVIKTKFRTIFLKINPSCHNSKHCFMKQIYVSFGGAGTFRHVRAAFPRGECIKIDDGPSVFPAFCPREDAGQRIHEALPLRVIAGAVEEQAGSWPHQGRAGNIPHKLMFVAVREGRIAKNKVEPFFCPFDIQFRCHKPALYTRRGESRISDKGRSLSGILFYRLHRVRAPGSGLKRDDAGARKEVQKGQAGKVPQRGEDRFPHPVHGGPDFAAGEKNPPSPEYASRNPHGLFHIPQQFA